MLDEVAENDARERAERREARNQQHQERVRRLRESRLSGAQSGREYEFATTVRGESIFHWMPVIDDLKREGDYFEALDLAWECMEVAETALTYDYGIPARGWTERVALICRKLGMYDLEIEVVERWLSFLQGEDATDPERYAEMKKRLPAAQRLLAKKIAASVPD